MLSSRRIHHHATCHSLAIPLNLACSKCKPALEKIALGQSVRTKFKTCQKPWAEIWSSHREIRFVKLHQEIHKYLGKEFEDGDTLVPTFAYKTKLCNKPQNI